MSSSQSPFDFSSLSPVERVLLAQELWDSAWQELHMQALEPELNMRAERRADALESGSVKGIPWNAARSALLGDAWCK